MISQIATELLDTAERDLQKLNYGGAVVELGFKVHKLSLSIIVRTKL
jgi:hypothetical protein